MNPIKLAAVILCLTGIVTTALLIYFLVPRMGPVGYVIATFDAITLVGIAFYLWNKPVPR